MTITNATWARSITEKADLGDVRRNERAAAVLSAMLDDPGASLSAAARGNASVLERYYRHARSKDVDPDKLLEAGLCATTASIKAHERKGDIVLVGDTTTLSYRHSVASDLGPMGPVKKSVNRGWIVHTVLAVDAESSETWGPIEQFWWQRQEDDHGKRKQRKKRAYTAKESFKWEASATAAAARLELDAHRAVFVSDRESDVYEYLADSVASGRRFIVRGAWNRRIVDPHPYLFDACRRQTTLAKLTLRIPQKGGRQARQALLELQATKLIIRPSKDIELHFPPVELNAVLVSEKNAPEGIEPVSWLLLTREPIDSPVRALRVVTLYSRRWRIEEFHKFWKSEGVDVENLRMTTAGNPRRVAVLMAFAACRLMQLRDAVVPPTNHLTASESSPDMQPPAALADALADALCTQILTTNQWLVLWALTSKLALPMHTPSRRWASLAVAKLGNWTDTKHTGRPGYKAYLLGWCRLMQACEAIDAAARIVEFQRPDQVADEM